MAERFKFAQMMAVMLCWLSVLAPVVLGQAVMPFPSYEQPIARDQFSTYNISFDSQEFDNLGDLDWRPLFGPYEGLLWNYFRVGANRHFFQNEGGKDAFAAIPLDIMTQKIAHTFDPSLSCVYNDSKVSSFKLNSIMFGCALRNGIPIECVVDFTGIANNTQIKTHQAKFSPPYARMNDMGRLEAGRAVLQKVDFDPRKFGEIEEVRFSVRNYSVLYVPRSGMEGQQPVDLAYSDSLLFIVDGVSYVTHSKASPRPKAGLEKRRGHVTDCFTLDGEADFNRFPIPYKDLLYDGFYRAKHLSGDLDEACKPKDQNASSGHIYAPGVKRYTDDTATRYPSIGIVYQGSKRKDMSIKSFYLGCEQYFDETSVLDTQIPCVIGVLSLKSRKSGDQPQQVHYQQVPIVRSMGNPPEDSRFEFVELGDGKHVTRVYFVLISADPNASTVSILVDNLTYYTRKGKRPQTGNDMIKFTNDSVVDGVITAVVDAENRNATVTATEDIAVRKSRMPAKNFTLDFSNTLGGANQKTGDFNLESVNTSPLTFVASNQWMGHAQDAQGNPDRSVFANNASWSFAPINETRKRFAYVELPWSDRQEGSGSMQWNGKFATIDIASNSGYGSFTLKSSSFGCYPAFLTAEDKSRMGMLGNTFECHFTVLGYKARFTDEPAEHAVGFGAGDWKNWKHEEFPGNFNDVVKLEFHVTYASTRNVRIFIDDIQMELPASG